jgi:hypothetical protein
MGAGKRIFGNFDEFLLAKARLAGRYVLPDGRPARACGHFVTSDCFASVLPLVGTIGDFRLRLGIFRRWRLVGVGLGGVLLVGDVFAVVNDARGGVVLLVVGVFDDVAHVDVLREGALLGDEVEVALGLGVGGEPVLAVNLLVVGGEGRGEIFVAFALVLGDGNAVDEDDLVVLLVDPDFALEVALAFFEGLGAGGEDVGVELVDVLTAEVGDVVFGQVFGGEDEGEAVLDLVEVGGGHLDALEGVLGGEDDVLFALAVAVEGDVGDLLVLAVDAVSVFGEGVDFDGLAEGVVLAGEVEDGLSRGELFDDLLRGHIGGGRGVEWAEAGGILGGCAVWICDSGDGWGDEGR